MSDPALSMQRQIQALQDDLERLRKADTGGGIGCRVYNNAAISIANNTLTDLTFNSEYWDTDGMHDTSVDTARVTCVTAGYYLMIGQVEFAVASAGRRQLLIVVDGATTIAVVEADTALAGGVNHNLQISTIYALTAGDFVTLRVFQNSGGPLNVNAKANWSPDFSVHRLV
jgi:hypothetical protein